MISNAPGNRTVGVSAVRVVLRGKAHAEWKVVVSGDRRTVRDDQYFIDDRAIIWGKDKPDGNIPILPRGLHQFPFRFQLPESSLPCSFESKPGFIRYYIKVTVDIPYASPPQGMKYFTIIGPHIDCMDEQYLKPIIGQDKRTTCCLCCEKGPVVLRTQLERSAYVCGESIKLRANVDNQGEEEVRLKVKLIQYVEYFIDRGVLGVTKEVQHLVLEYRGDSVKPNTRHKWDSAQSLVVPVMPPSLVGICRLLQIYYVLKVNLEFEKSGDDLHMHYPITVATVPFRIPNSTQPTIHYDVACEHVEGGMYIGPEFLLGQVYDGSNAQEMRETVVLYRPVYNCGLNVQDHCVSDVACEHVEGGMYIGPEFLLGQVYDGSNAQEMRETVVLYRPVYDCGLNVQDHCVSDVACEHVEGGMYIGPEFLLGQVYDGSNAQEMRETVVLYRPVYVCVTRNNDCNAT